MRHGERHNWLGGLSFLGTLIGVTSLGETGNPWNLLVIGVSGVIFYATNRGGFHQGGQ